MHSATAATATGLLLLYLTVGASPAGPQLPAAHASAMASAPIALSPCTSTDNGDPDLTSVRFESPVIDARVQTQTLRVVATATDSGGPGPATGIGYFRVAFGLPDGGEQQAVELRLTEEGTFVGALIIPTGFKTTGVLRVDTVELSDKAGNGRFLGRDWLHDHLLDPEVTILSEPDHREPLVTSLTANASAADSRRGPVKVRYTATLTDMSGISYAFVEAGFRFRADLHRISGTDRRGRWTGVATIPKWQTEALVTHDVAVQVGDKANNTRVLLRNQLERRGWPATLRVRARTDTVAPSLRVLRQSINVVDLRDGPGQITVTIRVIDAGSGVGAVGLGYGDDEFSDNARLVSGDRHRGTWRVTTHLPYCYAPGGTDQHRISVGSWDRLGSLGFTSDRLTYTTISSDTRPPGRATFSPFEVRPGAAAVLSFGEAVTGINDTTVPVRPFDPDAQPGPDPQPPVPGSWSCQATGGATVDCAVGAVRTARWTPSSLLPAGRYLADINPEHILGVTDLAGNAPTDLLAVFLVVS